MKLTTKNGWIIPAPARIAYFPANKIEISKYEHLRKMARDLSLEAQIRLEWVVFYETVGKCDASATAKYFCISRKTFHKWLKVFRDSKQDVNSLCDRSRTPIRKRTWMVTQQEEARIKDLRKAHMKYGKTKLKVLYAQKHHEEISTWKIERVIRVNKLYPDKVAHDKRVKRKLLSTGFSHQESRNTIQTTHGRKDDASRTENRTSITTKNYYYRSLSGEKKACSSKI